MIPMDKVETNMVCQYVSSYDTESDPIRLITKVEKRPDGTKFITALDIEDPSYVLGNIFEVAYLHRFNTPIETIRKELRALEYA